MPNWVENDLLISGPDVLSVLDAIKGEGSDESELIDFNMILPVPLSLLDVEYPGADEIADVIATNGWDALGGNYDYEWAEHAIVATPEHLYLARGYDTEEISKLVNQRRENIRLHGHPNRFKWCDANWGTGYNASNSQGPFWIDDDVSYPRIPIALIVFQAASKPLPIIEALAARFPDHTFEF